MMKAVSIADAFRMRRQQGPLERVRTGIPSLDGLTHGGIPMGCTMGVIGAPDAGKTLLFTQVSHVLAETDVMVGIMAIDEEVGDVLTRLVQRTARADGTHFTREEFEQGDDQAVAEMQEFLSNIDGRLFFYDEECTIEAAAADLDARAKAAGKRCALFIDSVQTASCDAIAGHDVTEMRKVSSNTKAARAMAIRYGMITAYTSESNRAFSNGAARGEAVNPMSAGAESRAVEFRPRLLLVLSKVPVDPTLIRVDVPKNKLGDEGVFYLRLDKNRQTLSEADPPEEAPKPSKEEARAVRQKARRAQTATERQQEKDNQIAEKRKVESDALRAVLRRSDGMAEKDVIAGLRIRLERCGDSRGKAIIGRAEYDGWLKRWKGDNNAWIHALKAEEGDE